MPILSFEKYHGLGNDFILFDHILHPDYGRLQRGEIVKLCHRRYGIGADGVLIFQRGQSPASFRMTYFNADGSRAETCLNGMRCIGLHAVRRHAMPRGGWFIIETDAGDIRTSVQGGDDLIAAVIPGPRFDPASVPVESSGEVVEAALSFGNLTISGTALSLGNPHFVVYRDGWTLGELGAFAAEHGADVENSLHFPQGVNFEIASQTASSAIVMAVWERGVGITLGCGSGACAAVAAGVRTGRLGIGEPVEVNMPGGRLSVEVSADFEEITLSGEARHIFSGEVIT